MFRLWEALEVPTGLSGRKRPTCFLVVAHGAWIDSVLGVGISWALWLRQPWAV